ncbi:50S ribosomal protein L25/general stress protein Ctc [Acinetobacter sp. TGL-Y2]|uniref:50S ribosomal protein L25/general stress protein Ctc n=1 Tax=Acinetobacter sp. TGL-Y2 TaxID=1407071 RepID=UPI000A97E9DA|nr:50S ribosomal protein L25/general stress protein Ctc [Acinetobacter sp. TGL-Y2]
MANFVLNAEAREESVQGKGSSRRLRLAAKLPAIIYGGAAEPVSITLELRQLVKQLENNDFFSSIITIDVSGKKEEVVIKALQRHPAKNTPMHADFMRITRGEIMSAVVPVSLINQDVSKGVKAGGIATLNLNEVQVETLPRNLPTSIEVDIADLEIGQVIHLSDLKLPKGVTIPALAQGEDHDQAVVSIVVIQEEVVKDAETDSAEAEKGE